MKIKQSETLFFRRKDVDSDKENMYIFTDNTDRDSGSGKIDEDSWYSKKYGNGKHFPSITSAVIRGLDNAYPITTQRWYNDKNKGVSGRWTDEDFEDFKKVIDDDFKTIYENFKRYKNIIIPYGGIFNSQIANISKDRTPVLFSYLKGKLFILDSEVNFYNKTNEES